MILNYQLLQNRFRVKTIIYKNILSECSQDNLRRRRVFETKQKKNKKQFWSVIKNLGERKVTSLHSLACEYEKIVWRLNFPTFFKREKLSI